MAGLQGLPDLQNAEFLPIYLQSRVLNQADQANQFNQVGLQQNQADLEGKGLANIFARENNPQLLEKQRLENVGTGYENVIKGVNADIKQSLAPEEKKAKAAEYLKTLRDNELGEFMSKAKFDMMSDNPDVAKQARNKYMMSAEEQSQRAKHADEMAKQAAQIASNEKIAAGHDAATRDAAAARAKGGGTTRLPSTYEGLINHWATQAQEAQAAGDMIAFANANQMLALIQESQKQKAGPQAAGVNATSQLDLSGRGVNPRANPTPPPAQVTPQGGQPQQPQAPAAPRSLADVQKMYPGVPPEKIKEAYKKKFGVELK